MERAAVVTGDPIYLDHAATTPLRSDVRAAMEPFLAESYANPSSVYRLAQEARSALDRSRDTVAACLGASPQEIIFTSGGTESNNAAIKGVALAQRDRGRHLVTSAIEHHAVLHPVQELEERWGYEATHVAVGPSGVLDPSDVIAALGAGTVLASIMWVNNEIGTIQPIEEIARATSERRVPLHVDAVAAAGTLGIDLSETPVDLLSISAHKFYGPKGVGALYVRRGTPWWPLLTGGTQERNRRAGTENVAGIVGMACALELAVSECERTAHHTRTLRDALLAGIRARLPGVHINGDLERRMPNNLNISLDGVHGESLLVGLDLGGIMASSGSACTSGSLEPSHVLLAAGVPERLAQASLRLTLGRENTQAEVERVIDVLDRLARRLRSIAPAMQER